MTELTIPLRSQDEAILVLGPYDRFAKLLRQALEIDIYARTGNLRYFFTIIIMGYAGFFTMLATCVAGLAFRWAATPDEAGSGG